MNLQPIPYLERQDQILTNQTPYNGRVNLEEPENPDARFQMFERIEVKNKATEYREPLKGDYEDTILSKVFFSAENIQIIQNGLRAGVYKKSGDRQLMIPSQNMDVLKQIMRHMFLEYSVFQPKNITEQVERLNNLVLDYTVPKIFSEAIGYLKYLEDQSRLVVPLELPQQPDRVYKQLELKPYM
jgi:hypothetical protein